MTHDPKSPTPLTTAKLEAARNPILKRAEALRAEHQRMLDEMQNAAGGEITPPAQSDTTHKLNAMRERARRLIYTSDENDGNEKVAVGVGAAEVAGDLGSASKARNAMRGLPARVLHQLEAALGHVRHSVVESCFYNLKLYAGMLAMESAPAGLPQKLNAAFAGLESAEARIAEFLEMTLDAGATVESAYAAEVAQIRSALEALRGQREHFAMPQDLTETAAAVHEHDANCRRALAQSIEQVTAQLAKIHAHVESQRKSIADVIEHAVVQERARLEQHGVTLELELESVRGVRLFLDEAAMADALAELLRNALRHGFGGVGDVKGARDAKDTQDAPRRTVIIGATIMQKPRGVKVTIRDNGAGVAAEILGELGRRGFTTREGQGGSGEGMAMVRAIVEDAHLGTLHIESEPKAGTTVTIELPLKPDLARIQSRN